MSYSADFTLSTNATFMGQIQMSMINNALQVASEAASAHSIVDSKRNTLAVAVLNNPSNYLTRFILAAIEANGETTLTAASTDAQMDSAISAIRNGVAGVTRRDQAVP